MPMHDWTRVDPNDYHTFHLLWIASLATALNHQRLPQGYYAMADHTMPPLARWRLAIKQARDRQIVSVIEIVSPGDKAKRREFELLVGDFVLLLEHQINLVILDPFPTNNVNRRVWEIFRGESLNPIQDNAASLVSYVVDEKNPLVFVDEVTIGSTMADLPLFLAGGDCVSLPLEETYQVAWDGFPEPLRQLLEIHS